MTRHEPEAYGDDVRDVLDGLRRLACETETPSELLPEILTRGEQLLPPSSAPRGCRWQRLTAIWRRPLVWAPAMGVVCILVGLGAGLWMSSRVTMHTDRLGRSASTSAQRLASMEVAEDVASPPSSTLPALPPKRQTPVGRGMGALRPTASETASAASAPVSKPSALVQKKEVFFETRKTEGTELRRADIAPAPREGVAKTLSSPLLTDASGAAPSHEVTVTLPTSLYADLQQHARRRAQPVADVLREAIDAYLQDQRAVEAPERTK